MEQKNKSPTKRHYDPSKIEHQIANEGCKCGLCQKMIFQEMMIVKQDLPQYLVQEKKQIGVVKDSEPYFIKFLEHLYVFDRSKTRLRLLLPQICLFDKGNPHCLFSKKKQHLPLRLIRNKQKLNYYEIKNFFYEGFTYHNRNPDVNKKQIPLQKVKSSITSEVKDKQAIKNQPIVIARFSDNLGQMLSLNMMDSLFKYNQKLNRQSLLHIQTLVSCKNYRQTRIKVNIKELLNSSLLNRAKNEIKILQQDIKQDEFGFIPEKQQFAFEEALLKDNPKNYLQYISLKLVLLNSLAGYKIIWDSTFKWVKGNGDYYYLVDLDVHSFAQKQKIWGYLGQQQNQRVQTQQKSSPIKLPNANKPRLTNLQDISNISESQCLRQTQMSQIKSPMTTISGKSFNSNLQNLNRKRSSTKSTKFSKFSQKY